jgi:hypothetical protein
MAHKRKTLLVDYLIKNQELNLSSIMLEALLNLYFSMNDICVLLILAVILKVHQIHFTEKGTFLSFWQH